MRVVSLTTHLRMGREKPASGFPVWVYSRAVKKMCVSLLSLLTLVGLTVAGCQATRAGYESAPYRVIRADGKVQVRDYPALMVVETSRAAHSRDGGDGSFGRLFRFITGGNERKEKIAMTTPVFMTGDDTNATMAFVLPAAMRSADVPRPTDSGVTVRELPAGRFAVLRYNGGRGADREAAMLDKLKAWMETAGLPVLSAPVYGYFDPPWTPAWLRRNEVMLRTEPAAGSDEPRL